VNVTFNRNTATVLGGALYNNTVITIFENNIMWGNTAPVASQIYNADEITIGHSDIEGSILGAGIFNTPGSLIHDNGGNINAAPRFLNQNGPDGIVGTADDNLRLKSISPCIDAGLGSYVSATTDLAGRPRFVDWDGNGTAIVDMGAYEKQ
jgi:predicted outer membrane repeat protein